MAVAIKNADEIAKMRVAGRLASELLDFLTPHVRPGVTTGELDRIAHDYQVNVQKVIPATLNYAPPGHRPYPASLCTSVNHVVCHGIPGEKTLKPGDIVNIDVTVIKDGFPRRQQPHVLCRFAGDSGQAPVRSDLRCHVAGDTRGQAGRNPRRYRRDPYSVTPRVTAFRWSANSAGTALAASFTKSRRFCTMAARERVSSFSPG